VAKVKFVNGSPVVPAAGDGPVPALMAGELTLARSGALDTDLRGPVPRYRSLRLMIYSPRRTYPLITNDLPAQVV
jgi:hypothetical protein